MGVNSVTLWVHAPPVLLERVAALLDLGTREPAPAVRPLMSVPDMPVLPLEVLENPALPERPAGGRVAVRFPLSSHRLVNELAFRLLVDRCAGFDPPLVVLPVAPASGHRVLEVPGLPLAGTFPHPWGGLELATVNSWPGRCGTYVTPDRLVVLPEARRSPADTARLLVHHRSFDADHCAADRLLAGIAGWPSVSSEMVEAALIAHEVVTLGECLRRDAAPVAP